MIFRRKPSPVKFAWHRYPPSLTSVNWKEEDIQSLICVRLDDWLTDEPGLFLYEASLEGIKLTPRQAMKAKALGMKGGVPDFRFYLSRNRLISIELKRKLGVVSKGQKQRHKDLAKLGFKVYVVKATTPDDGYKQILDILMKEGL